MIIKSCFIVAIAFSITMVQDVNAEASQKVGAVTQRDNQTEKKEDRVYSLMRKAAAYPVTDVAGCIGGVKLAASTYANLASQGALQSDEYTKFSIETQLKFALESGTPIDMYAFNIVFGMLKADSYSLEDISENEGKEYAQQTALFEAITCKFNSSYTGIDHTGPLPKAYVMKVVDLLIAESKKNK